MSRVRVRIEPISIDGRERPATAHNDLEGTIVSVDVDDDGFFGMVMFDGAESPIKFGFKSLEMLGGDQ